MVLEVGQSFHYVYLIPSSFYNTLAIYTVVDIIYNEEVEFDITDHYGTVVKNSFPYSFVVAAIEKGRFIPAENLEAESEDLSWF